MGPVDVRSGGERGVFESGALDDVLRDALLGRGAGDAFDEGGAVADRVLLGAMEGYRPEGDWKQRITALALRVREAFGEQPQLAAVWGCYASSGTGSRMVMEELLQALRASGLPDEEIPAHYHRITVLFVALIASEAGVSTMGPVEYEQGMELFRVAVLGADPERFPAVAHFARDVKPHGADRRAAFEEIVAAQLAHVEGSVRP